MVKSATNAHKITWVNTTGVVHAPVCAPVAHRNNKGVTSWTTECDASVSYIVDNVSYTIQAHIDHSVSNRDVVPLWYQKSAPQTAEMTQPLSAAVYWILFALIVIIVLSIAVWTFFVQKNDGLADLQGKLAVANNVSNIIRKTF